MQIASRKSVVFVPDFYEVKGWPSTKTIGAKAVVQPTPVEALEIIPELGKYENSMEPPKLAIYISIYIYMR